MFSRALDTPLVAALGVLTSFIRTMKYKNNFRESGSGVLVASLNRFFSAGYFGVSLVDFEQNLPSEKCCYLPSKGTSSSSNIKRI